MNNDPERKIKVALVGLGFGMAFVPIYLHHPNVSSLLISDPSKDRISDACKTYGVEHTCANLSDILEDETIDAVHLVTPIPMHAEHSVAVLRSGKHCACTVPMACRLADLNAIIAAQCDSGMKYMMMETSVYTREFLYVKQILEQGEFGKIQFLRGAHYQDMEGWPPYWMGLPPMHYATHAVSPLLSLANTRATSVHCFGSGHMREELHGQYGNPYPIETAIFQLAEPGLSAEVTRSLFETARIYTECFNVYGSRATFEWQQLEDECPVIFRAAKADRGGWTQTAERFKAPDRQDLLPKEIARFTMPTIYDEINPHQSFIEGGGHGGSHPHLVHEFVSSIIENREPKINAVTAAHWTAAGLCAHLSAMAGGQAVGVPDFAK